MKRQIIRLMASLALGAVFPALATGAAETLTIPAGSTLLVRLTTTLSTRTNQDGDPWSAKVIEPIMAQGEEVIPAGSTVEGRIAFLKEPGRVKGIAEMRLVAETITTLDDMRYSISAGLEDAQGTGGAKVQGEEGTIKAPSSKKAEAVKVGVGAGVGAGVGGIAAGGKGSLYGAGIGALAGLIRGMTKRGKDIILPQGAELTFVIGRTTIAKKIVSPADSSPQ